MSYIVMGFMFTLGAIVCIAVVNTIHEWWLKWYYTATPYKWFYKIRDKFTGGPR